MAYPDSIDTFTPVSTGQIVAAATLNAIFTALLAIEGFIGILPDGFTYSTIIEALQNKLDSNYASDTGTVNNYAISLPYFPLSLAAGQLVRFKAAHSNSGASTLTINGTLSAPIYIGPSTSLTAGAIMSGQIVDVTYDGTNFQLSAAATTGSTTLSNLLYAV